MQDNNQNISAKTKRLLETCDARLLWLFSEVAKHRKFTIGTYGGHRTSKMQHELWQKGRTFKDGEWIVTGDVVTDCDGYDKISKHQFYPSKAVDVWIEPLDWEDIDKWRDFVKFVYEIANKMDINVKNLGESIGDWPHWEVVDE